jgi:hypothetical protein
MGGLMSFLRGVTGVCLSWVMERATIRHFLCFTRGSIMASLPIFEVPLPITVVSSISKPNCCHQCRLVLVKTSQDFIYLRRARLTDLPSIPSLPMLSDSIATMVTNEWKV